MVELKGLWSVVATIHEIIGQLNHPPIIINTLTNMAPTLRHARVIFCFEVAVFACLCTGMHAPRRECMV